MAAIPAQYLAQSLDPFQSAAHDHNRRAMFTVGKRFQASGDVLTLSNRFERQAEFGCSGDAERVVDTANRHDTDIIRHPFAAARVDFLFNGIDRGDGISDKSMPGALN